MTENKHGQDTSGDGSGLSRRVALQQSLYRTAKAEGYHFEGFGGFEQFTRLYAGRENEGFQEATIFEAPDGYHYFYIKVDLEIAAGRFNMAAEQALGHAWSPDLRHWEPRPDALRAGQHAWDRLTIQAPLVIEHESAYSMIYNGVSETRNNFICLATSGDLDHWTEHPANPVFHPDPAWSGWDPNGTEQRCDGPDVIRVGDEYVMYYTAEHHARRCIACAVSSDLVHWRDLGPALSLPCGLYSCRDLESPSIVVHDDLYYLFYGQMGFTWFAVSDDPFRFDAFMPWARVLGCDVRRLGGEWTITSLPYCGWPVTYANTYHPDHKGLWMARIEWVNAFPFIRPLDGQGE